MNASPHQESLLGDDVGRKKYRRSEVFVAGGQPTVTYNPRPGQGFDQRVRDYLDEKHRILCITGPTKSGKTVLIREVVPNAIRLSGGDMRTIDDFWADIVDALGGFTDESAERTWSDSETNTDRVGAGFKPAGIGVDGDAAKARAAGTEQTRAKSRSRDPRRVAKQELRRTMRPIVLDDFHHVDPDVQQQIVRGVKDLVFDGVPVILIAVPHRSMDIVRAEREMRKRVEQLQIKPWKKGELEQIADLGFDALNIDCDKELARELASEAYGSPQLMQEFCLKSARRTRSTRRSPSTWSCRTLATSPASSVSSRRQRATTRPIDGSSTDHPEPTVSHGGLRMGRRPISTASYSRQSRTPARKPRSTGRRSNRL